MSFQFGFSNDDFSDDELNNDSQVSGITQNSQQNQASQNSPLDSLQLTSNDVKQPKWESLNSILQSLTNVRLSFETFHTPKLQVPLYRRELFDVKHQLMGEADDEAPTSNTELEILMGETNEDVRKNVYEGGLKSWECSIDLVDSLAASTNVQSFTTVLELGCGTALPSEYLFLKYLQSGAFKGIRLVLSDYNESVLRLVTIPNLIISWANAVLTPEEWAMLQRSEDENIPVTNDEVLLTPAVLSAFRQDIESKKIEIELLSGTWGRKFNQLLLEHVVPCKDLLVLTSETIYQPDTLPVISETLLEVLLHNKTSDNVAKAVLAAKDIYFGVGGSVVEFENYMTKRIKNGNLDLNLQTFKVNAGLKRSIVSIE